MSVIEEFIDLIRADRGDCDSAVDPNEDNSGLEPAVDLTCQNCMEAPGVMHDQDFPVVGGKPGWVCQRCHDLCSDCGNHPTEGHRASCRFNGGDV